MSSDSSAALEHRDIKEVGYNSNGFDSRVSLDVLRSIYLTPKVNLGNAPAGSIEATYGAKSQYNKEDGTVTYSSETRYPPVKYLSNSERKRILITGGAGFVGSHLTDRLMLLGHHVTVLDNFFTGFQTTVSHWIGHPNFEIVRHDVVEPFMTEVDQIYHLACPASPPHYQYNPVKTLKTSFLGTLNMLGLAKRTKARFFISSTSEVYGDPQVHPQVETYWGNVNCNGIRACYDEGKRAAETLTCGYEQQDGVEVRIVRIFNTFGPRMNPYDGRVVSNFIVQALKGEDLTVYGDGSQTRSFQYIHDLIDGMILLMNSDVSTPTNVGSAYEFTILEFAKIVRDIVEKVQKEEGTFTKSVNIIHKDLPSDDPLQRKADTTKAQKELGWKSRFTMVDGVEEMVRYYSAKLRNGEL